LGTGTIVDILKQVRTADWDRESLNMSVKHSSQLVCACSEDAARDVIWAGSLARVNTLKCLTHVCHREGEATGLDSRPRRWHCVILKVGKEGV
jgi:hypothetical protein